MNFFLMSLCLVELFLTLLGLHELFFSCLYVLLNFFLTLLGLLELFFNVSMFG